MDLEKDALDYHEREPRGKIFTGLSKPVRNQVDLSLAYSPGVAEPCRKIADNPADAMRYTGRGNLIGVITNGSAVLGLGDIGPLAAKPVMEGKAVLFKKFADIDVFDIEIAADDPDAFCAAVKSLEPTFGGINLEDIKAPECFYIEEKLRREMNIPVFHDDQHGTAIIAAAAFLNAIEITGRSISDVKVVFSGGGAAAIACATLFLELGVAKGNLVMCDSRGVIYKGRTSGLNPYKDKFALDTSLRTLEEAMDQADAFVGVSAPGVLSPEMVKSMAKNPIIFALANPDPEILPPEARRVRPDAIIATGRSDYPNQVNNVLGFPFIFRGALDVGATTINEAMKLAAVRAIADLAKKDVPDAVLQAYKDSKGYEFGRDYLIPKPVDPRVLLWVAPAVAKAAMESGVATKNIDISQYVEKIERILGPTRRVVRQFKKNIKASSTESKKLPNIVLAHGHDERVIKAAAQIAQEGDVRVTLLGSRTGIARQAAEIGIPNFADKVDLVNPLKDDLVSEYTAQLSKLRERKGVSRVVAGQLLRNHNYWAAMMVANNHADGMITGLTEPYSEGARAILEVIGHNREDALCAIHMMAFKSRLLFFADCAVSIEPTAEDIAKIAVSAAGVARAYGEEPPKVALLSFSSFGSNRHSKAAKMASATRILEEMNPDFLFDGEIQADAAINEHFQQSEFPFCRLGGSANVLIFPSLTAANISYKLLANLTDATAIGPILVGINKPAHVLERGSSTEQIVNMVYLAADQAARARDLTRK